MLLELTIVLGLERPTVVMMRLPRLSTGVVTVAEQLDWRNI